MSPEMVLPRESGLLTLPRATPVLPTHSMVTVIARRCSTLPLAVLIAAGCAAMPPMAPVGPTPTVVPGTITETTWEQTVDALHSFHFSIEKENRLAGTIQTGYLPGAGLLEPWHYDSVTLGDRIESSLQPIRRRALVTLTQINTGVQVNVEVIKERENPSGPTRHSSGVATYPGGRPLQRDLNVVIGGSTPPGWIALGRDAALERVLLTAIVARIGR